MAGEVHASSVHSCDYLCKSMRSPCFFATFMQVVMLLRYIHECEVHASSVKRFYDIDYDEKLISAGP